MSSAQNSPTPKSETTAENTASASTTASDPHSSNPSLGDLGRFEGHTPGPWEVKTAGVLMWVEGPAHTICFVGDGYSQSANASADAPLIAAAPLLLSYSKSRDAEIARLREALESISNMDWRDPELVAMGGSQPMSWSAALNRCKAIARSALQVTAKET